MDFHAVVETAIDGIWYSWDATRLAPRTTRIRTSAGRDAADTAFTTTLSGYRRVTHATDGSGRTAGSVMVIASTPV